MAVRTHKKNHPTVHRRAPKLKPLRKKAAPKHSARSVKMASRPHAEERLHKPGRHLLRHPLPARKEVELKEPVPPEEKPTVPLPVVPVAERERTSYDGDTAIKLYLREIGQVALLT